MMIRYLLKISDCILMNMFFLLLLTNSGSTDESSGQRGKTAEADRYLYPFLKSR